MLAGLIPLYGQIPPSRRAPSPQIEALEGSFFISRGIDGSGIRMAILDAGFKDYKSHPYLKHLTTNGQIIDTWDFVRNQKEVDTGSRHGTAVLSCIAGYSDTLQLGLATGAEFLLARTEMAGEPLREEENFVRAVDWAIEKGARIIQSSLGYTYQRYFIWEMDGQTSLAVRAVQKAVRHGILFVNSIGNEGLTHWHFMNTPADADSILSVGALDPVTRQAAPYSSYGPTADGRIKPNVCAYGTMWAAAGHDKLRKTSGTSYAAPLISGFAACAWQMLPGLNGQQIKELIEQSGELYPSYDYSRGFGMPRASRLLVSRKAAKLQPLSIRETNHRSYNQNRQWGVNRMHFSYLMAGMQASLQKPVTFTSQIGYSYRVKVTSFFFLGAETTFSATGKIQNHELVLRNHLDPALFFRLRAGQRGDYFGYYLDVGIQNEINLFSTPADRLLSGSSLMIRVGFDRCAVLFLYGAKNPDHPSARLKVGIQEAIVRY